MEHPGRSESWAFPAGILVAVGILVSLAVIWFIWIDKTTIAPISGGTALVVLGDVMLGQNREVLFDSKTGVVYSAAVRKCSIANGLIVGEEEEGWFILDPQEKSVQHFHEYSSYLQALKAAGIRDSPRLQCP